MEQNELRTIFKFSDEPINDFSEGQLMAGSEVEFNEFTRQWMFLKEKYPALTGEFTFKDGGSLQKLLNDISNKVPYYYVFYSVGGETLADGEVVYMSGKGKFSSAYVTSDAADGEWVCDWEFQPKTKKNFFKRLKDVLKNS
jgi:hypothetical protein